MRGLVRDLPEVTFVFFHFSIPESRLRIKGENVKEVTLTSISGKMFRLLYVLGLAPSLESLLRVGALDTVIFPSFYAWPVRTKSTRIMTFVPDTTYLDVPQYVEHSYFRWILRKGVQYSARVSQQMVVCSEATKRSIQSHYGRVSESISVIYPGYEKAKLAETPAAIDIPKKHILFVGSLEPRKNIANLIRGYVALPKKLREDYPLVLAGGKGWLDDEITQLIGRHAKDGVRAVGYVTSADRERLYSTATVFAYPVMYEGFGMPVIEAQSHGVPVLSTNNSSLPEATGGIAEYCETNPESITRHLAIVLQDRKLRQELSKKGLTHAAKFTWLHSQKLLTRLIRDAFL